MVTILMPTMAAFRGDIETAIGVLENNAGEHQIGLEIIGLKNHFTDPKNVDKIITNINEVAGGGYVSVHGIIGAGIYEERFGDMRLEKKGGRLLDTYMKVAKKTGAQYVHVHGAAGYKGVQNRPEDISEQHKKIRETLLSHLGTGEIPLGIENLPSPSAGDYKGPPGEVWCDCVETVEDCMKVVRGTSLEIAFDTCHYAAGRDEEETNLVSPVTKLRKRVNHFHISDVKGYWKPEDEKAVWKEGVIPGEGRIGEENFRALMQYLRDKNPSARLCVEVENKNLKTLDEGKETIKRVVRWLE